MNNIEKLIDSWIKDEGLPTPTEEGIREHIEQTARHFYEAGLSSREVPAMKLRVVAEHKKGLDTKDMERLVTHYVPQYYDERRGWTECYIDNNLCARYYYKIEDAIEICKKYAELNAPEVVWSSEV